LGIAWEYEPEGFELPDGTRYLPDFWLPNTRKRSAKPGLWVEIKGARPTDAEREKCGQLARASGQSVCILSGSVDSGEEACSHEEIEWWNDCWGADSPMLWVRCEACGATKFEFAEGSYMDCPECGGHCSHEHPAIVHAITAAR